MATRTDLDTSGGEAAAHATTALALAAEDPAGARAAAEKALELAAVEDDPAAAASAERALGVAARTDHDLDGSMRHLRRAIRIAERGGHPAVAAQARITSMGTLAMRGDFAGALREAERAKPALHGTDRARLELQRSTVLTVQGERLDEALAGLRRALPVFRDAGETFFEAAVLENLGLVQCYLGAMDDAEANLRAAVELRRKLDQPRLAAMAQQELGFVAGLRGDIPAALAWFDKADEYLVPNQVIDPIGMHDRCVALLQGRLTEEAAKLARAGMAALAEHGVESSLPDIQVLLAEAALLHGDPDVSREAAHAAAHRFRSQGRKRRRVHTQYLAAKADWASGDRSTGLLTALRRCADTLEEYRWLAPAVDAHVIAGRLALERGQGVIARRELEAASAHRHRGPLAARVHAWLAEALLRRSTGDRRGAGRALAAGMRLVDRHRALLGATDLRVHAASHAAELAAEGLRMAVEAGRPAVVLDWAERWRAGSLALPPPPPADPRLSEQLGQLRRVAGEVERAMLEDEPTTRLLQRQARLERSVQSIARQARGAEAAPGTRHSDLPGLRAALDERALVEFVQVDDVLHAVTVAGGRTRLRELGPVERVAAEADALRFSIRRLAMRGRTGAAQEAARLAFDHSRRQLDDLLLAPLAGAIGDRPLVVVPTGALHTMPWATLPSCTGRPVAVAPSAGLWRRAREAPAGRTDGPSVLVAGPDLPWAGAEIDAVSAHHPDAVTLTGTEATVEAVAAALDGAAMGHVAAHGSFRSDNPLFSSLRLADGTLTVYDLEQLGTAPELLLLSACDAGLSDVRAGDELRGVVASLIQLGTRTVVASILPVPDEATQELMVALHGELATAEAVEALARVQSRAADDPAAVAAAAGFVCFGC